MQSVRARARERAASALALLALSALALLPPGGLTICLGHDGHLALAVEPSHEAGPATEASHCPCDPAPGAEPSQVAEEDSTSSHAPCDDLPLAGTSATALPRSGDGAMDVDLLALPAHAIHEPALAESAATPRARTSRAPAGSHAIAIALALTSRRIV